MNIRELQIHLGLDPGFEGVKEMPDRRATGRTTRMLCEAVVAAQAERVLIVGYNRRYSHQLQQQARAMCEKVGINPLNIIVMQVYDNGLDASPEIRLEKAHCYDRLFLDRHYETCRPATIKR